MDDNRRLLAANNVCANLKTNSWSDLVPYQGLARWRFDITRAHVAVCHLSNPSCSNRQTTNNPMASEEEAREAKLSSRHDQKKNRAVRLTNGRAEIGSAVEADEVVAMPETGPADMCKTRRGDLPCTHYSASAWGEAFESSSWVVSSESSSPGRACSSIGPVAPFEQSNGSQFFDGARPWQDSRSFRSGSQRMGPRERSLSIGRSCATVCWPCVLALSWGTLLLLRHLSYREHVTRNKRRGGILSIGNPLKRGETHLSLDGTAAGLKGCSLRLLYDR